jgi:hypothetical protein
MTSFSYPLNIRNHEPPGPESVNLVEARVPGRYSVVVNTAKTGTAAAATTIPLFVAPAGSTFYECVLDVTTPFNNDTTNIRVGIPTSTGILFAATTANTAGRRAYAGTGAQVSANAIALTADTTVQAIVSIDTSAVTAGSVIVHVVIG